MPSSKAIVAFVAITTLSPYAVADKAAADAAFAEARKLMAAGKIAEACPKFEISYQEDQQLGALLNLADCHEKLGKLATAWAEFRAAIELARSRKDSREAFARSSAEKLAKRISRVVIRKDASATGLSVRLDDRDITALVDVEIPIDPGVHTITSSAVGRPTSSEKIEIEEEGSKIEVAVPAKAIPVVEAKPEPEVAPPVVVVATPRGRGPRPAIGIAMGLVGLGAAGVGLYFGRVGYMKWNDSRDFCTSDDACDEQGARLVDDAKRAALKSSILVGAGAGLIVIGTLLWLTAPEAAAPAAAIAVQPVVAPDLVGAAVGGRF